MPESVTEIEDQIRHLCLTKRVRIVQFFPDYDELRSGFVTANQFFRCLCQTLGLSLNQNEEAVLIEKYECPEKKKINYRKFCAVIDQHELNTDEVPIVISEISQNKSLEEEFEGNQHGPISAKLYRLLYNLAASYETHGLCIRKTFKDFDTDNTGRVTESQFHQNFPPFPDTGADDILFLVQTYIVPNEPGLVDYLKLYNDVMNIYEKMDDHLKIPAELQGVHSASMQYNPSLAETIENIKVQVFKYGIRTTDFFKDYDKHKCGAITENQFMAALKMAVGKEARLGPEDWQQIIEAYRTVDGKVRYKEFCEEIENAFTRCHLERKPTEIVVRPPVGSLSRGVRQLTPEKESKIAKILAYQAEEIRLRQLTLFPFFKDYDRGVAYSRTVTKSQFARVLHFLKLDVTERQLDLLAEKFAVDLGDVNYPLYIQSVDPGFVAQTIGDVILPDPSPKDLSKFSEDRPLVSFEELMSRLKHIVLVNRLKVCPYFKDFDPLRCGSITKDQFRRGLSMLGFSKIGFYDLTNGEFQLLCDQYQNPKYKNKILWTEFMNDINSVFIDFEHVKFPGRNVEWREMSEENKKLYNKTMERIRQQIKRKRILIEPCFKDFDRHGNQRISAHQFEQCLSMLNLPFTQAGLDTLKARFWDEKGILYVDFIHELFPLEHKTGESPYKRFIREVHELNEWNKQYEQDSLQDLESVLIKVKTKVFKERFRLIDFMKDYDKLNSGKVSKNQFHRALSLSPLELTVAEVSILKDKYQSSSDSESIDYRKFCDEVESIFTTQNLEKNPLKNIEQFRPEEEWKLNVLTEEEKLLLQEAMNNIAEKVREYRMQLFPLMEDFDRLKKGCLSQSHFRRVLMQLELGHLFSDEQLKAIYKKFKVRIGGQDDFNYIAFCDTIYALAGFVYRRP